MKRPWTGKLALVPAGLAAAVLALQAEVLVATEPIQTLRLLDIYDLNPLF
jgi:hypothetical protein